MQGMYPFVEIILTNLNIKLFFLFEIYFWSLILLLWLSQKTVQNKGLMPPWNMCTHLADVALQADNSEVAFSSLEFFVKWIIRGENQKPPVLLTVDEGLLVAALGTAGRTYNGKLLNGAWEVLKRSLRQMRTPNPESFLAKIYAQVSLGQLQNTFATLHEFEKAYGSSKEESSEELFSPFTSLNPLVVACCRNGFVTLDSVCSLSLPTRNSVYLKA